MTRPACRHRWKIDNLRHGYLVIEGCFHCNNRVSFFSEEPVPPIDEYREGDHFWSHRGSYQASRFDLKCEKCAKKVSLKDVIAVMMCMRCSPDCGVYNVGSQDKGKKLWVYVALCADTSHVKGKCIREEGIRVLNQYFNQNISDPNKKIIVVSCKARKYMDTCEAIVLADTGLTEIY